MEKDINALTQAVIGAAIEVHKHLGPGFLESVYEDALAYEMQLRHIPFKRQYVIGVQYKQKQVGESRLDFWVDEQLIVELKAIDQLMPIHTAQVISYLKTIGCELGLLLNFNVRVLKQGIKRVALSQ